MRDRFVASLLAVTKYGVTASSSFRFRSSLNRRIASGFAPRNDQQKESLRGCRFALSLVTARSYFRLRSSLSSQESLRARSLVCEAISRGCFVTSFLATAGNTSAGLRFVASLLAVTEKELLAVTKERVLVVTQQGIPRRDRKELAAISWHVATRSSFRFQSSPFSEIPRRCVTRKDRKHGETAVGAKQWNHYPESEET